MPMPSGSTGFANGCRRRACTAPGPRYSAAGRRSSRFPPYLANLLVAKYPSGDAETAGRLLKRWFEVLRPYGGTAYLELPEGAGSGDVAAGLGLPGAEIRRTAGAEMIRRAGPLPQSAPWTHEYADAALSYFSRDRRVRPPLEVLWYGDGPDHGVWTWHDYNTGIKPQVVGGRLFAHGAGSFSPTMRTPGACCGRCRSTAPAAAHRWKTAYTWPA